MGDQPQSSHFQALFESALHDYQRQTGTALADHPLAERLQNCDSVVSVTAVLQEQAQVFGEFGEGDGRLGVMKPLRRIVSVLYMLSAGTALSEDIWLVR